MQPEHSTELHTLLKLTWLLVMIANRSSSQRGR